jgi:hypothetical protein
MAPSALQAVRCASTVTSSIVMMVRGVVQSTAVSHPSERMPVSSGPGLGVKR